MASTFYSILSSQVNGGDSKYSIHGALGVGYPMENHKISQGKSSFIPIVAGEIPSIRSISIIKSIQSHQKTYQKTHELNPIESHHSPIFVRLLLVLPPWSSQAQRANSVFSGTSRRIRSCGTARIWGSNDHLGSLSDNKEKKQTNKQTHTHTNKHKNNMYI